MHGRRAKDSLQSHVLLLYYVGTFYYYVFHVQVNAIRLNDHFIIVGLYIHLNLWKSLQNSLLVSSLCAMELHAYKCAIKTVCETIFHVDYYL